jgi:hypothetical protein
VTPAPPLGRPLRLSQGDEGRHTDLRQRACDLMVERREEFEPFVEDDQVGRRWPAAK